MAKWVPFAAAKMGFGMSHCDANRAIPSPKAKPPRLNALARCEVLLLRGTFVPWEGTLQPPTSTEAVLKDLGALRQFK